MCVSMSYFVDIYVGCRPFPPSLRWFSFLSRVKVKVACPAALCKVLSGLLGLFRCESVCVYCEACSLFLFKRVLCVCVCALSKAVIDTTS